MIGELGVINIQRVGEKKWCARTSVRNLSGKRVRVQATAPTRKAADQLVQERARIRAFAGSGISVDADTTLSELVERTLTALRHNQAGRSNRIQTINMYERHVPFLVGDRGDPAIGNLQLWECSLTVIHSWLETVSKRVPTSARQLQVLLTHAFDLAIRHGVDLWRENPARTARLHAAPKSDPVVVEVEEFRGFWERIIAWENGGKRTDLSGIVGLLMATGARPGESLAVRWEDVDLDAEPALLTISGTVVRQDGKLLRQKIPKTDAAFRTLSLPDWFAEMLRQRKERATNELVFPGQHGGLLDPNNVWNRFRNARGEEYKHVMPKSFRSTVATVIDEKHGPEAAARQLGHTSPTITGRYYIRRASQAGDHTGILGQWDPKAGPGKERMST